MRVKQAQMLSLNEYSKDIRALDQGQVIVDMEGRDEPFFVQVPYVSDEDIRAIAEWLEHEQSIPAPKTQRLPELGDLPMKQTAQSKMTLNLDTRSEEHTSELQSPCNLVCRLLLAKQ